MEKNLKAQSYKRSQKSLVQKRTAEYEFKSLKDEAEEMIEEMVSRDCEIDQLRGRLRQSMPKELRRVRTKGRGGSRWDLWVVQICIELLVARVAPSAIPTTIQTAYETFYGSRNCRRSHPSHQQLNAKLDHSKVPTTTPSPLRMNAP